MKLHALVLTGGLLFAPVAFTAPLPSSNGPDTLPVLSVQAKSVDQLRDILKAMGKNLLAGPLNEKFEREILSELDGQTFKGIDTKRPAGLYAVVSAGLLHGDLAKSSIVFLVPVANENDFIALLGNIGLKPEKKGDYWSSPVHNAPFEATIWFQRGYAHICLATEKPDPKTLLDPRDVISDKETAAIAIHLRVDRLPEDFKAESLAVLAQAAEEADARMQKNENLAEARDWVAQFFRISSRWLKSATGEVKEVVVRVDLDPKTGLTIVETSVDAKSGTALAKSFAGLKPTQNAFADIIGADSAAHVMIQSPLFVEDARDLLAGFIDVRAAMVEKQILQAPNVPKEKLDFPMETLQTLSRTLKSGNLDFAASLRGPDKNDQYTAVGALSVKNTAAFEKALKAGLKIAPNKKLVEMFKFDAFMVDAVNVHEIAVADDLPPEAQKIFGKSSV
jgi:hypothetical protein